MKIVSRPSPAMPLSLLVALRAHGPLLGSNTAQLDPST